MKSIIFRQGDTATISLKFKKDISNKDVRISIYDTKFKAVIGPWTNYSDPEKEGSEGIRLGNVVTFTLEYEDTINLLGLYFMDTLLRSSDDLQYVCSGNKPIELFFEKSQIAKDLQ